MKCWHFLQFCFGLLIAEVTAARGPKEHANILQIQEISILKDNDYISGTNEDNSDGTKGIYDLKLLKNITEDDDLTTSYEYKSEDDNETIYSGNYLPFCPRYFDDTQEGTVARFILYALRFTSEKCPRTELGPDTSTERIKLNKVRMPQRDLERQTVDAKFTLYADKEPIIVLKGQIEPYFLDD